MVSLIVEAAQSCQRRVTYRDFWTTKEIFVSPHEGGDAKPTVADSFGAEGPGSAGRIADYRRTSRG